MQLTSIVRSSNCPVIETLGFYQDVYDRMQAACDAVHLCSNKTEQLVNKLGNCASALDKFNLGDQCPASCKAVRDILMETRETGDDACLDALDAELPEDVRNALAEVCSPQCALLEEELAECFASLTNLNIGDELSGLDTLDLHLHRCPASCMHVVQESTSTSCVLFDGVDEHIYNGMIQVCNITNNENAEVFSRLELQTV